MYIELTLAQRWDESFDVEPTLGQPTLLFWMPRKIWYDNKNTGGRLNKKDGLTRYGNSHVKDKTS